jgi:hypothetical protein
MQTSKPATPAHPAPAGAVTKRKSCDTQKIHLLVHLPSLDFKPTKGYVWAVLVSIGLAVAFSVVMADKVTLKTPAFELRMEKSK